MREPVENDYDDGTDFFQTGSCLKSPQRGDKEIFFNKIQAQQVKLSTTCMQDVII
jgi:hypothetical protein